MNFRCANCGREHEWMLHLCPECMRVETEKNRRAREAAPLVGLHRKELSDGTYMVWWDNTSNEHANHWHVAPDGTILAIKEDGDYRYNRGDIRRRISEVTGLSWENGWRG